jgi:hypothetical protein
MTNLKQLETKRAELEGRISALNNKQMAIKILMNSLN